MNVEECIILAQYFFSYFFFLFKSSAQNLPSLSGLTQKKKKEIEE